MEIRNLSEFNNGWFLGFFDKSIIRTSDFEVAYHIYQPHIAAPHIHKISTEINLIIRGRMKVGEDILGPTDIFIFRPEEHSDIEFLEETELVIVKMPSVPNDKYEI